jgi:hypothetical protein
VRKRQEAEEFGYADSVTEPLVIPLLILAEALSAVASGATVLCMLRGLESPGRSTLRNESAGFVNCTRPAAISAA